MSTQFNSDDIAILQAIVQPGSRTYVVAASGGDYTSVTAAVAAASSGDTIYIKDGTYAGRVSFSAKQLNFKGQSRDGVIITHSTVHTVDPGPGSTFENLTISTTDASFGKPLFWTNLGTAGGPGCIFTNCALLGIYDVCTEMPIGCQFKRCYIYTKYDGPYVSDNCLFEDCWMLGDGGQGNRRAQMILNNARNLIIRRCVMIQYQLITGDERIANIVGAGDALIEDSTLECTIYHATNSGEAVCITDSGYEDAGKRFILKNVRMTSTTAGTGTAHDIRSGDGQILFSGVNAVDISKIAGDTATLRWQRGDDRDGAAVAKASDVGSQSSADKIINLLQGAK